MRQRLGARWRGSTGPRRPWQCSRQARRQGHQRHYHQQQWASQPPVQHQQQWASQAPAQQQQSQKHQRQPQQQQQRKSGHPSGWGPSRVCFRCDQPGHFYAECRAIPPAPLNTCPPAPYTAPQGYQQANCSAISPADYAYSSGEHGQQIPTPPASHGPPVPPDSSWSFSTNRAVMTQFCPPGESVSLSRIVSNNSSRRIPAGVTRSFSNSSLLSTFAAQPQNSRSAVWIGDSGASCHMSNDASKMYCVRLPLPDQREVTTSDGTGLRVECIGNINEVTYGKSDNQSRCVMSRTYRT